MTSQLDLRQAEGATVIAISGELDAAASDGLRDELLALIPDGGNLRLDLSDLTYISSAGLRTLLLAYRQAVSEGSRVTLAGVRDEVRFVMAATGFLSLFDVEDNVLP
jgi:anti-sigma B factor antagonist